MCARAQPAAYADNPTPSTAAPSQAAPSSRHLPFFNLKNKIICTRTLRISVFHTDVLYWRLGTLCIYRLQYRFFQKGSNHRSGSLMEMYFCASRGVSWIIQRKLQLVKPSLLQCYCGASTVLQCRSYSSVFFQVQTDVKEE